jgi:hypothetical protein
MRKKTKKVDLKGRVPKKGTISFVSADVSANSASPLAIVHYEVAGVPQPLGLRLDLDKRVFLDHFDDPGKEKTLVSSASTVASAVVAAASK